jgi:hypothetical protein
MFNDESKFVLSGNGEGIGVWRRTLEHFMLNTVHETVPFGGASIMVWCGITINTRKDLVFIRSGGLTARRFMDEILEPQVIPRANVVLQNFICMQGNTKQHITPSISVKWIDPHAAQTCLGTIRETSSTMYKSSTPQLA